MLAQALLYLARLDIHALGITAIEVLCRNLSGSPKAMESLETGDCLVV